MQHKSRTAQERSVKWHYVCHSLIFFQNSIITALHLFTVQLLKPVHLEEDRLIKTFFENKKFWSFFCQRTNKIQGSTLYNRWTYLTSQEMALKIHDEFFHLFIN